MNQQSLSDKSNRQSSTASLLNDEAITDYNNEVIKEYKKFLEGMFTQCGDSYYTKATGRHAITLGGKYVTQYDSEAVDGIARFKDVYFETYKKELSEAEKLNGLEWSGGVVALATAVKVYQQDKGWSEWGELLSVHVNSDYFPVNLGLAAEKKKSIWQLEKVGLPYSRLKKISCSEIPN